MNKPTSRFLALVCGALWLLGAGAAARADDTEIFFGNTNVSTPANILLILDTSGSMDSQVSGQAAYDSGTTYTGSCSNSYYYFVAVPSRGTATPPDCSNAAARIPVTRFACAAAATPLGNGAAAPGYYTDTHGGLIRWGNYTSTTSNVYTSLTWPFGGTFNKANCQSHTGATWKASPSPSTCTVPTTNTTHQWQADLTVTNGTDVECGADQPGTGTDTTYPTKNSDAASTGGVYSATASDNWWQYGSGRPGGSYIVYSANYLNYYVWAPSSIQTRLSSVQNAATGLLGMLSGLNVGLMTYSFGESSNPDDASGGMVRDPVQSIDGTGVRTSMIDQVNHLVAAGYTPLSETMFEAYRYFSGGAVLFGGDGSNGTFASKRCTAASGGGCNSWEYFPSVASSQSPAGTYKSPAEYSCQKNYIVYLTDGLPTNDNQADTYIEGTTTTSRSTNTLSNVTRAYCNGLSAGNVTTSWSRTGGNGSTVGTCTVTTTTSTTVGGMPNFQSVTGGCTGSGSGRCLSAVSKYMYQSDLRSSVSGTQNVKSYFIGFGSDFYDANTGTTAAAFQYLQEAGTAGGGGAYSATDYASLTSVFNTIVSDIAADVNTSFSAPTVAVNAFNRTQTLDDLYVSVFVPGNTLHWPGNVKKYKVVNETVVDSTGAAAVDPASGFFKDGSQSYWSAVADGPDVTLGGAAHKLPNPDSRNVYTYLGSNAPGSAQGLTDIDTAITAGNAPTVLGLTGGDPSLTNLLAWAKGRDIKGENPPSDTSGIRHAMGDPVHSEPAVVIYSGATSTTGFETVVYVTTNDGYLHAFNATSNPNGSDAADSGQELWSFIPQELLTDLRLLYADQDSTTKHYGLDGPVRILKYDINGDGVVDPAAGDRVLLYFSTGRNTSLSRYYALDVTDKNSPQFLWSISSAQLPGLGQTWSTPTVARVTVNGTSQNGQHLVLVFGGGYDAVEDGYSFVNSDTVGNHIFMVDAKSGALLWSAGPTNSYNFHSTRMTHSIPSPVTVLDVNNDGFADRMYVGDMAGQVWRFDITNGNPASSLVAGGVIASLGTKEDTTHTMAATRRFYAAPDVALVEPVGGKAFLNVAIGSGYRGHPVNAEVSDRMYSIRDYNSYGPLTQAQYDALHLIVDGDLTDITSTLAPTIAEGAYGWKLRLTAGTGEKVVTSARTLNNVVYFTSYTPGFSAVVRGDPCSVARTSGNNRVYAVSIFNGAPVKDRNDDGSITLDDRKQDLKQGGIAPGISLLFPGESANKTDVLIMSGPETVDTCTSCRSLRKTYWYDGSVQ